MDGQESIELDWDVIEQQVIRYDQGDRSAVAVRAKMLQTAYFDGYIQCESDHEKIMDNFNLMMSQPAGHA